MFRKIFWLMNWGTSLGGRLPSKMTRFIRYCFSGGLATLGDIALLWYLTSLIGVFYIVSTIAGFLFGTIINYTINRLWAFRDTQRKILESYLTMVLVGVTGIILTVALMGIFVEIYGLHYLVAKVITVVIVLFWNYILNLKFTFAIKD